MVTLAILSDSVLSLQKLWNSQDVKARISFRLAKMGKEINAELEIFNEKKQKLYEKYGVKKEDNNFYITDENMEVFQKEYKELIEEETTISIPEIHLSDVENVDISPRDISTLDWLIKE